MPVKVLLEPMSEFFFIQPGIKVEIHAICDANTNNVNFVVAPNDSFLTVCTWRNRRVHRLLRNA